MCHHVRRELRLPLLDATRARTELEWTPQRNGTRFATDDPAWAARHVLPLTVAEINQESFHGALPLSEEAERAIIESGVRALLRGYAPR
ncbi:hypothetical protein ACIRPT_05995 [Streptomyces sp. NPDC101227]|uniref:hypothetical protein n=1 Tax=Streptomyces sp. NPDC101227 TaxID=3366136 RepID=UPI003815195F